MHSAQHSRERAAQARRLAGAVADADLKRRLEELAREYEEIAEKLEPPGETS